MESACTKQGIPCPFSECGCEYRCARKEMNKHIRDEPVKHLTLLGQTILAHKKTLEMHSEIMDVQNEKLGEQQVFSVSCYTTKCKWVWHYISEWKWVKNYIAECKWVSLYI